MFGINPESAGLTAVVALLSLVLATLLVARPGKGLLVAVAVVGLVFAALDAREAVHQANESNVGLLVLAALTGLRHLSVAVAAGRVAHHGPMRGERFNSASDCAAWIRLEPSRSTR